MGKTLRIQNCTNGEVKEQTKIGECLLPSGSQSCVFHFVSKSINIKIHIAITLLLYGCKTWYLTSRKKHRFRIINNTLLKKIFGWKEGGSNKETGENYMMRSFMICTPHQVLFW